jgi:hypothetical protein
MFIDQAMKPTNRAPAERNVCGDELRIGAVSLLRSEENLLELSFYRHFVPMGRGSCFRKTLPEPQEVDRLLYGELPNSRHSPQPKQ